MKCTLDEIPEQGRLIYIQNHCGGIEIARFSKALTKVPYTRGNFVNWWKNYSDQTFFCTWDYVPERVERCLEGMI